MTEQEIRVFYNSLARCTSGDGFFDRFYGIFLTSSREVEEKFKKTDFVKQKRALAASIYMIMLANEGKPEGHAHLERIAKVHSREQLDIKPELYDLWLDCLIETVKEFDRTFSNEVEQAWRHMMQPGIELMKSRY